MTNRELFLSAVPFVIVFALLVVGVILNPEYFWFAFIGLAVPIILVMLYTLWLTYKELDTLGCPTEDF
jgi:hypothetical protein